MSIRPLGCQIPNDSRRLYEATGFNGRALLVQRVSPLIRDLWVRFDAAEGKRFRAVEGQTFFTPFHQVVLEHTKRTMKDHGNGIWDALAPQVELVAADDPCELPERPTTPPRFTFFKAQKNNAVYFDRKAVLIRGLRAAVDSGEAEVRLTSSVYYLQDRVEPGAPLNLGFDPPVFAFGNDPTTPLDADGPVFEVVSSTATNYWLTAHYEVLIDELG